MINRNFNDGLRFLSKATPTRLNNAFRVLGSYLYSKYSGKASHWGMPVSLSFEPTTSCNLRCPECPSGLRSFTRATGMLDDDLYKRVIDEVSENIWYLLLYFQGEPYLHPSFFDMVKYASSRNIYTATSTNGHYLSGANAEKTITSGLDRLIISIDGTTQETYAAYRKGGNLEKVLQGAKNLISEKKALRSKTPHIIFQFLVVRHNEHQVEEVKKLAKSMGVNEVGFKTAQIYDYENGNDLIPLNDKYSRYRKTETGKYGVKNTFDNHCWKMWHSSVVTWDGNVIPCCFDKDAWHKMGSLQQQTFKEIWNSEAYVSFRQSLLRSRSEIEMCRNCTEGTTIWAR